MFIVIKSEKSKDCLARTLKVFGLTHKGDKTLASMLKTIGKHKIVEWSQEVFDNDCGIMVFEQKNNLHVCAFDKGNFYDSYPYLNSNRLPKYLIIGFKGCSHLHT